MSHRAPTLISGFITSTDTSLFIAESRGNETSTIGSKAHENEPVWSDLVLVPFMSKVYMGSYMRQS